MSVIGGNNVCLGCNYDHNIGYIEQVLVNILSKLPAKDVIRCKVVAKMWYDLLSGQHFSELHFSCSRKNPKFVVYLSGGIPDPAIKLYQLDENGSILPFATFPRFGDDTSFEVVSSFNGLICCTDKEGLNIRICNPFTRQFQALPSGSPSVVTPEVGVVFDPKSHNYKVFRFFLDPIKSPNTNFKCEIYVPGSGSWTRVGDVQCQVPSRPRHPCGSYVNVGGRAYWLVWSFNLHLPDYVVSVDMEDNFTRVELPEYTIDSATHRISVFLVEFDDRLLLISFEATKKYFHIWSLESREQSSWSCVGPVEHGFPETYINYISSVAAVKNEILFALSTKYGNFCYRLLNMDKMTWRDLQVSFNFRYYIPVVLPFTESLLSVM